MSVCAAAVICTSYMTMGRNSSVGEKLEDADEPGSASVASGSDPADAGPLRGLSFLVAMMCVCFGMFIRGEIKGDAGFVEN